MGHYVTFPPIVFIADGALMSIHFVLNNREQSQNCSSDYEINLMLIMFKEESIL